MRTGGRMLAAAALAMVLGTGVCRAEEKAPPVPPAAALPPNMQPEVVRKGATVFAGNCSRCHSIRGVGGTTGPDLSGVAARRDEEYIRRQLKNPKAHNKESRMPSFSHMSEEERDAVVVYLLSIYFSKPR
ncbi:MAG TPA: c-type cytochrome [Verrucomicrobiae bacterium]|nr:c-type cytochrome [Verrucomicrobiae bacterium]